MRFDCRISGCWLLCCFALPPVAALAADESQQRPNFVVIVADDLGWNDVGYHGSRLKTPRIDRLAAEGVRLNRHYVATMCSATRAALLSGRYWSRFGVTGATNDLVYPPGTPTLARALSEVGYRTSLIGKWHLGSKPEWGPHHFGFQHSYGSLAGGVGPYSHQYKRGPYSQTWHRNGEFVEEPGHVTDLLAAEAVGRIEAWHEEPFFLYVPFTAPHIPMNEPQKWLDLYPEVEPLTARHYAAAVSHLDDAIGQIVDALARTGCRERTLLVFFSDNGAIPGIENNDTRYPGDHPTGPAGGNNDPLRGRKAQVYEGGVRVPALVNWPGTLEPGLFDRPVHVVDWMPTLCGLGGLRSTVRLTWDGVDLWPALTGQETLADRPLYCAGTGFRSAALIHGDWKLNVFHADTADGASRYELYHLGNDLSEQHNLADSQPDRVAQMRQLLEAAAAKDRDAVAPKR